MKEAQTPIHVLQYAFEERKLKNDKYSLRAFARDLGMSATHVGRILKGQRNLTYKQAEQVASAFKFSKTQSTEFVQKVILSSPEGSKVSKHLREKTDIQHKNDSRYRPAKMMDYSAEKFKAISEWQHLAIMNLTCLKNFKNSFDWIAKRLGITKACAEQSVKRLLDLGLLVKDPVKGLVETDLNLYIGVKQSEPEMRNYERSLIEKALRELEKTETADFNLRLINGINFPVASDSIPEIREMILEFQRKIIQYVKDHPSDEVYQLNCQLFPLTQKAGKK